MKQLRLVVVATTFLAPLGAAGLLAACSDDTSVTPPDAAVDGARPDTGGGDGATDGGPGTDADADVFVPKTLEDFVSAQANTYCARAASCCTAQDAGGISDTKCKSFLRNLGYGNTTLHAEEVTTDDAGAAAHVVVSPTLAAQCLSLIAAAPCTVSEPVNGALLDACRGALNGTQPTGGSCIYSLECAQPAYCKVVGAGGPPTFDGGPPSGTCQPLEAIGANCSNVAPSASSAAASTAQEACASRAFGTPPRYCDAYNADYTLKPTAEWVCLAGQAPGSFCPGAADYCTSRQCDFNLSVCIEGAPFVDPTVCGLFK
jgi:hypothetical protein